MQAKLVENLKQIDLETSKWAPEYRKGMDICRIRELGCLLDLLWALLRAIRVVLNTACSTKLPLQSFAFRVFDIVSCHVPFCVRFSRIFAWLSGSQNLENRVLVEAKREFTQKLCFGIEHWFSSKSDPPKPPLQVPGGRQNCRKMSEQSQSRGMAGQGALCWTICVQNGIRIAKNGIRSAISTPSRGHQKSYS